MQRRWWGVGKGGAWCGGIRPELDEGQIGDARDRHVVDFPAKVADRDVGADSEAQLHGLSGQGGPEVEGDRVPARPRWVGGDEGRAVGEGVAGDVGDHSAVAGGDRERGHIGPARASIGRKLDDTTIPPHRGGVRLEAMAVPELHDEALGRGDREVRGDQADVGEKARVRAEPDVVDGIGCVDGASPDAGGGAGLGPGRRVDLDRLDGGGL